MTPEHWRHVKELFYSALEQAPDERAAFLAEACSEDKTLRAEVESLLASHDEDGSLEGLPGAALAAQFVAENEGSWEGRRIGPYKIIRQIGHGGMGAVFLAARADDQYQKRVALKLVKHGMDSQSILRRFRQERQILASLDHNNIAKLLDGGTTEDNLPYFAMEYVEGRPITQYCDRHRLSTSERLLLFRTICSAVHYAHQNLVVHRDLKPSNILITAEGVPKLLDFGIAKLLAPELSAQTIDPTATGLRLMTLEYASPEQVRGETITTASDVYSLGVLLYEVLTGHRPYRLTSRSPDEIARVICEQEPEKPSTAIRRLEEVPGTDGTSRLSLTPEMVSKTREGEVEKLRRRLKGDLDNIVLMAMRKEPQRRYASVNQLSGEIRRHLEGLPIIARTDTFSYRAGKFVKRHKASVTAAALIAVTLLAGIVTTAWQARVARFERARAERRFNDVRKLANSVLFELHDAIEKLPGSTPARELLVKRALEYLDSLALEAGEDRTLQLELATAYAKVGNVQWNRYYAHLGNLPGAFQTHQKALAIREAVSKADSSNFPARIDLAHSYLWVGDVLVETGKTADALENYRKSLKVREELLASQPKNANILRSLAISYQRIGDTLGNTLGEPDSANLNDRAGALENFRKMQAIFEALAASDPSNTAARHSVAIGYEKLGRIMAANGDLVEALGYYRNELAIFEALSSANPMNMQFRRDVSVGYSNVGDVLSKTGDTDGAMENYSKALAIREELVTADPTNAGAHRDIAFAEDAIGNTLAAKGDHAKAREHYRKALGTFEKLHVADPSNLTVRSRLSRTLNSLASLSAKGGSVVEARTYMSRLLVLKKTEADRPTATSNDLNSYAWLLLTCEPPALRSPSQALSYAQRALEMTKGNDAKTLDTLALAYFLTGDQARAIESEEKALAVPNLNPAQRHELEASLAKFKAGPKVKKRP